MHVRGTVCGREDMCRYAGSSMHDVKSFVVISSFVQISVSPHMLCCHGNSVLVM